MAPIRPRPRRAHRSTTTSSSAHSTPTTSTVSNKPSLKSTKTDSTTSLSASTSLTNPYKTSHKQNKAPTKTLKRASKHASLLSRLQETSGSQPKVTKKRRRPGKKLVTNWKGLEEALPENVVAGLGRGKGGDEMKGAGGKLKGGEDGVSGAGNGAGRPRIEQKSLKSRPGAMKRREKLVKVERERFMRNMAVMAGASEREKGGMIKCGREAQAEDGDKKMVETEQGGSRQRWAAIRSFIEQTIEREDHAKR